MKTIFQHIERVKGQPHHIRKQVAFASAATLTVIVALAWFVGSISTGAFAIREDSSFAPNIGQGDVTTTGDVSGSRPAFSGIAGAGAAAVLPQVDVAPAAHIEIIDAAPAAAGQKKAEQTVIPF